MGNMELDCISFNYVTDELHVRSDIHMLSVCPDVCTKCISTTVGDGLWQWRGCAQQLLQALYEALVLLIFLKNQHALLCADVRRS